ncbi:hypothetical protein TWF751_010724 [Orbilia oligospora]|nr:hypothetical protein TWF751_010724 [Orbilia oligospora]
MASKLTAFFAQMNLALAKSKKKYSSNLVGYFGVHITKEGRTGRIKSEETGFWWCRLSVGHRHQSERRSRFFPVAAATVAQPNDPCRVVTSSKPRVFPSQAIEHARNPPFCMSNPGCQKKSTRD